ncbi:MAG: fimbrillin family protein [Prevotella sp.]|nr:fimbrillin family protein [Prevotella sp.]
MKNIFLLITAAMMLLSCSQDEADNKSWRADDARIAAKAADFEATTGFTSPATRTALTPTDKGLAFTWSEGDILGVFSKTESQQIPVYMSGGADSKDATFSSKGFQLAAGEQYVAYYPIVDKLTVSPVIPVDYTGQTQDGNGSYAHLASHDYMVSDAVTSTATNVADFTMHHVGAILRLRITMPKADSYSSVVLSSDANSFTTKANLDLFNNNGNGLINKETTSDKIALNLKNASTTETDKVLTVWMMLSPADFSNKAITVTVKSTTEGTDDVVYTFSPAKKFESGKAYSYDVKKDGMEFVDLDLPSGNLWATCNIGASSPEEYGDYITWGENKLLTSDDITQYKGYSIKYNGGYWSYGQGSKYDMAKLILGGNCVTPDQTDWIELIEDCAKVEFTTLNGVKGVRFIGGNGNSIFLPYAGYYSPGVSEQEAYYKGEYGKGTGAYYWTSEIKIRSPKWTSVAAMVAIEDDTMPSDIIQPYFWIGASVRPIILGN